MARKYSLPTKVIFGEKSFQQLFSELSVAQVKKPLIICGNHFINSFKFRDIEEKIPVFELFSGVEENPSTATADAAAKVLNEGGCDAVIGIGGGSAMDVAKVVACMKGCGKSCESFYRQIKITGKNRVPFFALPTTSGSGSEVTKYSVLTLLSGEKKSISDNKFYARVALVDPELTYTMSPEVTASCGVDAFCQAIEAYWAGTATTETGRYAAEAIQLAYHNLFKAVNDPDKQVRQNMSLASLRSGQAFGQTGTTAPHGCSYAFTKYYGLPHGFAVGITLPWFLGFYAEKRGKKCLEICNILGAKTIPEGKEKIIGFLASVGAPTRLDEIGCPRSDFPKIIEMCMGQRPQNPRGHSRGDIERMLNEIY
ncbi:Iron-containing alcohol dehydrogenase [uncultured archaeon]|nr:Iron-containing alcohol dehydrogenase [uncultured archaeon]